MKNYPKNISRSRKNICVIAVVLIVLFITGCTEGNTEDDISGSPTDPVKSLELNDTFVQHLYSYIDVRQFDHSEFEIGTNIYQSKKTTEGSLTSAYKLHTVFAQLRNDSTAGITKNYSHEEISGFLEGTFLESSAADVTDMLNNGMISPQETYTQEKVEKKFYEIYGEKAVLEHQSINYGFDNSFFYRNSEYLHMEYQGGGGGGNSNRARLIKAESEGDKIYLYDKYVRIAQSLNACSASDEKVVIGQLANEIEDEINNFLNTNKDIKTFKHIFQKKDNDSYYWISTEMVLD